MKSVNYEAYYFMVLLLTLTMAHVLFSEFCSFHFDLPFQNTRLFPRFQSIY